MASKKKSKWIQKAHIKKGGLHETLGKKPDAPITSADIARAKRMGGKAAKQARLAETFRKMRNRKRGGKR